MSTFRTLLLASVLAATVSGGLVASATDQASAAPTKIAPVTSVMRNGDGTCC